jgi:fructoselysine-6-P-deglycase FrlB-like protein
MFVTVSLSSEMKVLYFSLSFTCPLHTRDFRHAPFPFVFGSTLLFLFEQTLTSALTAMVCQQVLCYQRLVYGYATHH